MTDTCVMPDGNCTGCNHNDHEICVASEEFRKTCSTDCENCDFRDEGEAFCDLEVPEDLIPLCKDCLTGLSFETASDCSECVSRYVADMRRYLYRNVACEARKTSDIARHVPDLPRWA